MAITREVKLILSDVGENSNKFWHGFLHDNGDVVCEWGRVGVTKDSLTKSGAGERFLDKKVSEKKNKGYTEQRTIGGAVSAATEVKNSALHDIAKEQIKLAKTSSALEKLIDRLVKANIHKITKSTQISYNDTTGLFSTPLGVVTLDGITEARDILAKMKPFVTDKKFKDRGMIELVNQYLRIIPQNVGMKLSVESLLPDKDALVKQSDLLDSLESSYQAFSKGPKTVKKDSGPKEQVFDVTLDLVESGPVYKHLSDFFYNTKKAMHGYGNIQIQNIYQVSIKEMNDNYEEKLGNDTEVFHGTSGANCLSILKSGLKCSPPSTAAIAGKMWGNGIYGAINSSKSLGYTFGRWGQGSADTGWLFICDFAMGKISYPTSYGGRLSSGFDSVWAKASKTGLAHDELIVYRNSQCKIKYLLEVK